MGLITKKFKIEIGTIFKDNKRDITIIDREKRTRYKKDGSKCNDKWYKYHCNRCGAELWIIESRLLNEGGCSCCSNKTVVKGINDITTTNPELVKYFINKEDAYTHTYSSNKKIKCKCPECGFEKEYSINKIYYYGFSCPKCSDGISYPEKFMFNLLEKLKEQKQLYDFIYQYTKINAKWCDKYKYDFYFKLDNEEYIIETHGEQHYKNSSWNPLKEIKQNDIDKYNLAINNGIKPENYIVIDCRKSNMKWIKNNIIHSKLNEIFNLTDIDWIKIEQSSEKNLTKEVCDYWYLHNNINKEELTISDLCNIFKISLSCIITYLNKGTKLGWCKYYKQNNKNKPVEIFKDNKSLGIFESCHDLDRQSENLFVIKLNYRGISMVANGKRKQYKGYIFKYISKEEYEQRKNKQ